MWLFNWLCLIISELTQLVSVCWWSPNLLLSSFSKGLILKWPNRRLIAGDLWPSVITYDMLCPHLTPYKAILTIDSLLLLHHQIISQTYPILFDDSRYSAKVFFLALTGQKILKTQSNWLLPRDKKGRGNDKMWWFERGAYGWVHQTPTLVHQMTAAPDLTIRETSTMVLIYNGAAVHR